MHVACESFHSHFKENFYKEKPNIVIWLNIMKQIQTYIYCLIRSIHTPKKSKNYRANKRSRFILLYVIKNNTILYTILLSYLLEFG